MTNPVSIFTMLWRIPEFKARYIGQNIVSKRCQHKSGLQWQIVASPYNEYWSVYLLCSNAEQMGDLVVHVDWNIKLLDRSSTNATVQTEGDAQFSRQLHSTFRFPGCRHFMTLAALQENIHKYADDAGSIEVLAELTITMGPAPAEASQPSGSSAHLAEANGDETTNDDDNEDGDHDQEGWNKITKSSRARGRRGRGGGGGASHSQSHTHTHTQNNGQGKKGAGAAAAAAASAGTQLLAPKPRAPSSTPVYSAGTVVAVCSNEGFWLAELQSDLTWGIDHNVRVRWYDQHPGAVPGTGLYFQTPVVDEVDARSIFQRKLTLVEISSNPQRFTLARDEALDFVLTRSTLPPQTPTPATSSL